MESELVIQTLVKMGRITEEDIRLADIYNINVSERKGTISDFHSFFCNRDHDTDCQWYREKNEQGPTNWERGDHKEWADKVIAFANLLGINWHQLADIVSACGLMPVKAGSNIIDSVRNLTAALEVTFLFPQESEGEKSTHQTED